VGCGISRQCVGGSSPLRAAIHKDRNDMGLRNFVHQCHFVFLGKVITDCCAKEYFSDLKVRRSVRRRPLRPAVTVVIVPIPL
jgi:hypothetical protein